ncbi:MAG: trypsin-like peptidase domain-containing protein [Deltaproteobacteria bacterium]|nr:trypsin-like peptidase domain-containing protein [Deltaproteobacteria bacterium]
MRARSPLFFLLPLFLAPQFSTPSLAVTPDPITALEKQRQRLFDSTAPAVVFIGAGDGFGSGFFVSADGLALTNAHVVGKSAVVDVVLHDGRRLRGQVVERGLDNLDLALVKIDAGTVTAIPPGDPGSLRVGSWVASIGHGRGGVWSFTEGMVSNIYPAGSTKPVFQTQIPLNPGNSGGPILDRNGRVVGIVTTGLTDSNAINFAIPIDAAMRGLPGLASLFDCLVIKAPAGVAVFVDGKMAGKGPRIVVPAQQGVFEIHAVIGGKLRRQRVSYPQIREVDLVGQR